MIRATLLSVLCALLSGCTTLDVMSAEELDRATLPQLKDEWRQVCGIGTSRLTNMKGWSSEPAYKAALVAHALSILDLSDAEVQQIHSGEIRQGSTYDVVYWVWGPPQRSYRAHSPYGTSETWYYMPAGGNDSSVTFHDGVVTWWHVEE